MIKKTKPEPVIEETPALKEAVVHTPIPTLSIDYANEGLNDMARTINLISTRLNEQN